METVLLELWTIAKPFLYGYLLFYTLFFLFVLSFIVYVFFRVIGENKSTNRKRVNKSPYER
jgi:uncharacterized membrane protein